MNEWENKGNRTKRLRNLALVPRGATFLVLEMNIDKPSIPPRGRASPPVHYSILVQSPPLFIPHSMLSIL
jgi:hypothetical protein